VVGFTVTTHAITIPCDGQHIHTCYLIGAKWSRGVLLLLDKCGNQ
jgi:hypothetical protein